MPQARQCTGSLEVDSASKFVAEKCSQNLGASGATGVQTSGSSQASLPLFPLFSSARDELQQSHAHTIGEVPADCSQNDDAQGSLSAAVLPLVPINAHAIGRVAASACATALAVSLRAAPLAWRRGCFSPVPSSRRSVPMVALLWLMAPTLASASSVNSPLDGEPPLTGEPPQPSAVQPEAASDHDMQPGASDSGKVLAFRGSFIWKPVAWLQALAHNLAGRLWPEGSQHGRALQEDGQHGRALQSSQTHCLCNPGTVFVYDRPYLGDRTCNDNELGWACPGIAEDASHGGAVYLREVCCDVAPPPPPPPPVPLAPTFVVVRSAPAKKQGTPAEAPHCPQCTYAL